jgi:RNA polymerase sigma factor (sigma-70 family)
MEIELFEQSSNGSIQPAHLNSDVLACAIYKDELADIRRRLAFLVMRLKHVTATSSRYAEDPDAHYETGRNKHCQQSQKRALSEGCISAKLPVMLAQFSDEMLMERYRDGDLAAFKELYQRHSGGLYRFIAWRSPRREWVDEIIQDSWASLHTARDRYQPDAQFRTYLYQIARNRLIDLMRQRQLILASELGQDEDYGSSFEHLVNATCETLSPEAALEKKQRTANLYAAISSLPNEQKEALVLQQFNGMGLEEIAVVTVVPIETVKSRLRYAMQKLRAQLQQLATQGELT